MLPVGIFPCEQIGVCFAGFIGDALLLLTVPPPQENWCRPICHLRSVITGSCQVSVGAHLFWCTFCLHPVVHISYFLSHRSNLCPTPPPQNNWQSLSVHFKVPKWTGGPVFFLGGVAAGICNQIICSHVWFQMHPAAAPTTFCWFEAQLRGTRFFFNAAEVFFFCQRRCNKIPGRLSLRILYPLGSLLIKLHTNFLLLTFSPCFSIVVKNLIVFLKFPT